MSDIGYRCRVCRRALLTLRVEGDILHVETTDHSFMWPRYSDGDPGPEINIQCARHFRYVTLDLETLKRRHLCAKVVIR